MYWVNMVLGLALIAAPFALGYSDTSTALWSSIILGAIIALASGYKAIAKDKAHWEEWVDLVAGIVAVLIPFALGFSALTAALWASIILGIIVAALAGYQLYTVRVVAR